MDKLAYETINAVIKDTSLTSDDPGLLSAWLYLDYGTCGQQGFGGYSLYLPKDWKHHTLLSPAGHFIFRCMEIAEVTEWGKLRGKSIRVRKGVGRAGTIQAIGHIVKDDWFDPAKDFEEARTRLENGQEK